MNKFKVGDEVVIKGVVTEDNRVPGDYKLKVAFSGSAIGHDTFTEDGLNHKGDTAPCLFLLSEVQNTDVAPFKDEIERLKNELEQTRNYYSDMEKELKSLRKEKDTFLEEYSKVLEANDKLNRSRELAESALTIQLNRIVKLDAQVEILKQVIKELK